MIKILAWIKTTLNGIRRKTRKEAKTPRPQIAEWYDAAVLDVLHNERMYKIVQPPKYNGEVVHFKGFTELPEVKEQ